MSRAVYLVCESCGAPFDRPYSDGINQGEQHLRELWATRLVVRVVVAERAWDFKDVRPGSAYSCGDWFKWIACHAEHDVILRYEYGGTASTDGMGTCTRALAFDDVGFRVALSEA